MTAQELGGPELPAEATASAESPAVQTVEATAADEPATEIAGAAPDQTIDDAGEGTEERSASPETDDTRVPTAESNGAAATEAAARPVVEPDSAAEEVAAAENGGPEEPVTAAAPAPIAEAPVAPPRPLGPEPQTMEELLAEQTGEIRSLKHGDVVEGQVVRIDKDEILVDIGAKSEGVVSNRELYGRHAEQQPVLNIGDTVLVYVLQPESDQGHAVLSLRRAGLERKWRSMQELFDAGTIIEAPVIDHNKGGLIVDCGIRGFVPISQIVDFPRRPQNDQPRDAAQEIAEKLQPFVGRKLRLKILEVNRKANRLILSEKVALYEERREKRDELFSSLQVNQRVTGSVRSIAPFGIFIDLGGIDGLVHKSELSWNKVNNPEAGYRVGDEVEAEVIDINHERGRISLSIRRLQPDPWESTVADYKVGDIIDGTVTKIVNFGAFVRVRDGLEGLIHISELSHQRVAHPADVVHEGQQLKLKIISLDSERHRLGLSLKQAEEPAARPAGEARPRRERGGDRYDLSQAVQEPEGGIDNTLAAAFAQVRQQMAESEQVPPSEEQGPTSEQQVASSEEQIPTAEEALPASSESTTDAVVMEDRVAVQAPGTEDQAPSEGAADSDEGTSNGAAPEAAAAEAEVHAEAPAAEIPAEEGAEAEAETAADSTPETAPEAASEAPSPEA